MLIVIEGVDGCGKDTVADALAVKLHAERINFPNDKGVTGPMIRSYLKKRWVAVPLDDQGFISPSTKRPEVSNALAFQALQVANRMEVMPKLQEAAGPIYTYGCKNLVVVRYWQSTVVYGQLDGLDPEFCESLSRGMAQAQFNFLIDIDPEIALERRAKRDGPLPPERYEGKLDLMSKTCGLYRKLWVEKKSNAAYGQWIIIDGREDKDKVFQSVLNAL